MNERVSFIDHLKPSEEKLRLLKAAEFFTTKDFALCDATGLYMRYQYDGGYTFGILEGVHPSTKTVTYFWGLLRRNVKQPRPFIGTVYFQRNDGISPSFIVQTYGRKYVPVFEQFATAMTELFPNSVELNLWSEQPKSEIFKPPPPPEGNM